MNKEKLNSAIYNVIGDYLLNQDEYDLISGLAETSITIFEDSDGIDFHFYDAIIEAIDIDVIYYKDEWTILQIYCTPKNADFNNAINDLIDDLNNILIEYYKEDGE